MIGGPRRNRIDPFGDLHAVPERGWFTGNRGCLVDDGGELVRHHRGNLWIACRTSFRGRRVGLARAGRWTPVFFLDDAVALAAGHRPCGECRHAAYLDYRDSVAAALGRPVRAGELNRRLAAERLRPGRGLSRAADRRLWTAPADSLPDGTVVLTDRPRLVRGPGLWAFDFAGWREPEPCPDGELTVLTPPTSVLALRHGFRPVLALAGWTRT
ncbi:MAG TPA: hypothetical protein VNA11_11095 [Pseudonocardia sp.]|nr:hypothetical protein [Pseudonocardia sp.]